MEHFRVMAKLHMLSTFVCLAAACGGQRQPIMRRASRLHSWDVFAYDLLPNRLSPLGQVSSGQRQPITCALRAWFLGRFRIRPVTQSAFASWTGQ